MSRSQRAPVSHVDKKKNASVSCSNLKFRCPPRWSGFPLSLLTSKFRSVSEFIQSKAIATLRFRVTSLIAVAEINKAGVQAGVHTPAPCIELQAIKQRLISALLNENKQQVNIWPSVSVKVSTFKQSCRHRCEDSDISEMEVKLWMTQTEELASLTQKSYIFHISTQKSQNGRWSSHAIRLEGEKKKTLLLHNTTFLLFYLPLALQLMQMKLSEQEKSLELLLYNHHFLFSMCISHIVSAFTFLLNCYKPVSRL